MFAEETKSREEEGRKRRCNFSLIFVCLDPLLFFRYAYSSYIYNYARARACVCVCVCVWLCGCVAVVVWFVVVVGVYHKLGHSLLAHQPADLPHRYRHALPLDGLHVGIR